MRLLIPLLFFSIIIISSCSNKKHVLTEDYNAHLLVDTAVHKLTKYGAVYAKMTGPNEIRGFGGGYSYKIDDFNNFLYTSEGYIGSNVAYNDFHDILYMEDYTYSDKGTLSLRRSMNNGLSYEYIISVDNDQRIWYNNSYISLKNEFNNCFFTSVNTGWVFSYMTRSIPYNQLDTGFYSNGVKVYKVNNTSLSIIATINKKYAPLDAYFENDLKGKLLVYDKTSVDTSSLAFFHTYDGGYSWQGPFPLPAKSNTTAKIAFMNTDRYLVYSSNSLYRSSDGCNTFEKITLEGSESPIIEDIHVVTENLIYAAVSNGAHDNYGTMGSIYKSIDMGRTWNKVSTNILYVDDLDFYDHLNGVSNCSNIVQVTHNGGATWKPIIFPILK